eukprot:30715-Pyramimonas_sp.AAC.1
MPSDAPGARAGGRGPPGPGSEGRPLRLARRLPTPRPQATGDLGGRTFCGHSGPPADGTGRGGA